MLLSAIHPILSHFMILTSLIYHFLVSEFSKVGIFKKNQKEWKKKKWHFSLFLSFIHNRNKKSLFFFAASYCLFSHQNKPKLKLFLTLSAIIGLIVAINPSLTHMTFYKSSQNAPFPSFCYLLQNQAIKTHIVI